MEIKDIKDWIINSATSEDCSTLKGAIKLRGTILRSQLKVGDPVEIEGISPKYLNGLKGTFKGMRPRSRKYGRIELDETSTTVLRARGDRFEVPNGVKNHVISGIPVSCMKVLA